MWSLLLFRLYRLWYECMKFLLAGGRARRWSIDHSRFLECRDHKGILVSLHFLPRRLPCLLFGSVPDQPPHIQWINFWVRSLLLCRRLLSLLVSGLHYHSKSQWFQLSKICNREGGLGIVKNMVFSWQFVSGLITRYCKAKCIITILEIWF